MIKFEIKNGVLYPINRIINENIGADNISKFAMPKDVSAMDKILYKIQDKHDYNLISKSKKIK